MKITALAISQTNFLLRRRLLWILGRFRLLWFMLLTALLLSGCVQYKVGVSFDSPNRGEIVQHIKLGERLMAFSGDSTAEWLNSVERRARQLQGKAKRISDQEVTVTIPFNNGSDLAAKFNKFFNPTDSSSIEGINNSKSKQKQPATSIYPSSNNNIELATNINSEFSLTQNNLLLLLRNRLSYDLDLRSLSLLSTDGNLLINSGEILELEFSLNTPWGARSVETVDNAIHPQASEQGRRLVWTLKPGQLNHVEAVFWLPSPLGIGAVVIALFVFGGIYLKSNFLPAPQVQAPQQIVQ